MISDIRSTLNQTSDKKSSSPTLSNTATITKLISEIKLIENLSFIKIQGSESLNHQGKPTQLIHALSGQQPFTLINTGTPVDISDLKNAQLNKKNPLQATLTTTKATLPNQITQTKTQPQTNRIDNLVLASRVLNLTVMSTSLPSNSLADAGSQRPSSLQATSTPMTSDIYQVKTTPTNSAQTDTTSKNNRIQANLVTSTPQLNTIQKDIAQTSSTKTNNTASSNATQINTNNAQINSIRTTPVVTNSPYLATVTDGETEFPILSQTQLKRGDVVRVLVDMNNNMQALPPKATITEASSQTEALRQSLPKQLSLGEMSQLIKQLHTTNESTPSTLPIQTQQALKQLMQGMPSLSHLTTSPEAMKQAIQTSGTFSESLLLQDNKSQLPEDLKLNLNRLKETQEATGALRLASIPTEQIANAVERITTSQLRHFSDTNQISTPSYPLHIELPVRDATTHNLVQIEINKDEHSASNEKQDRRWLVKLKFDFEETGKFEARTSIQANKVSIIFVAENKETLQKLQQNIPILKKQLTDKEIDVEKLDTFHAKLTQKEENHQIQNKPLIDVRT